MFAILSLLLFTVILTNGDVVTDVSNYSNDYQIDESNGNQIDGPNDYQIDDSNGYQIDGSNDYQIDDSNGYQIDGSNDYQIDGSIHDQLIETYSTQEMEGIKVNISSLWSEVNEIKAWTQQHDANIYKNSKRKGYQAYKHNRNKFGNRQREKGPQTQSKYSQKNPGKYSGKRWNKQNGDRQSSRAGHSHSSDDEPIHDEVAAEISNLAQIQTTDMRQQKKHEDSSDEDSVETGHSKNSQRPQKNEDSSEENSTEISHSKNSQRQHKNEDSSEESSTEKKRSTDDHEQQNKSDSSDENTEKSSKVRTNLSTRKLANHRGKKHIRRKQRRSKKNRRISRRTQKLDENELISQAFCDLEPNIEMPESNVTGTIVILQKRNGKGPLHFHVNLQGFQIGEDERSRTHGFHIHANPLSEGGHCNSTGPHFNPLGLTHGSLYTAKRHLGDFGNIVVNKEGKLVQHLLMDYTNTLTGQNSIISKSMDVHEFPDDLGEGGNEGSLKNGNAGRKLACCTVHSVAVGSPAITQN